MHILWVKVGGLWPPTSGGRLRSFHIISGLAHRHRVTLLTTHGPGEEPGQTSLNLSQCRTVSSFPHEAPKHGGRGFRRALIRSWFSQLPVDLWRWRVPELRDKVTALMKSGTMDLCVVDFLSSTPNIPLDGSVPTILFAHNVEYMIWDRLSRTERRPWRRLLLEMEWRKMRRYETQACAQVSATLTVSDIDRSILQTDAPLARVSTIDTGVDTTYFAPNGTRQAPGRLVFTGSMDWYPNEDAILYFASEILPRIRSEWPGISVVVAGRNPSRRLQSFAATAGIRLTGTVEDIRPYVEEAEVYIVPLRIGGGTRLKIFEALAMGKAVVSTGIGAEGLPLSPAKHFLRADDPAEFAQAVISLLRDPSRRSFLGRAGRELVEARYSWAHVVRQFEAECERVVTGHAR